MQVKVCGLTTSENIESILSLGVDYVGLIFYPPSKRYVGDGDLAAWLTAHESLFADVKKVGVFVNAEVDYILNCVHDYQLDYVQLHGDESPGYCQELQLLWSVSTLRRAALVKAFSVTPDFDFSTTAPYAPTCEFFIFDTGGRAEKGGTGAQWDWAQLDDYTGSTPFLLSGGIGPRDAERVLGVKHPQLLGVDLNSRFEAGPGVKDVSLLRAFLGDLQG